MSLKLHKITGKNYEYIDAVNNFMTCSWGMHTPYQYKIECEISKENFEKYKYCIEQFNGIIKDIEIEDNNIVYFNLTCPKNTGKLKRFLFKITRYLRNEKMFEIIENFYNLHQKYGDKHSKIDLLYISHLFVKDLNYSYNPSMDLFYDIHIYLLKSDTDKNFFSLLKSPVQYFNHYVFRYKFIYGTDFEKNLKDNIKNKNIENIIQIMKKLN